MLSTANDDELDEPCDEFDDPVPVELPLGLDLPLPAEELLLEELLVLEDALVVPAPETVSPTSPDSETIVPLSGAYSLVFCTACSSLCTVSLSLFTAAFAEARFAPRVAALCLVLDEVVLPLPLLVSCEEVALCRVVFVACVEPPDFDLEAGLVVFAGGVAVDVVVGAVDVPGVVTAPLVVVVDGEPVVCVGVLQAATAVYVTLFVEAVAAVAVLPVEEPWLVLVSPSLSCSFARFASAD